MIKTGPFRATEDSRSTPNFSEMLEPLRRTGRKWIDRACIRVGRHSGLEDDMFAASPPWFRTRRAEPTVHLFTEADLSLRNEWPNGAWVRILDSIDVAKAWLKRFSDISPQAGSATRLLRCIRVTEKYGLGGRFLDLFNCHRLSALIAASRTWGVGAVGGIPDTKISAKPALLDLIISGNSETTASVTDKRPSFFRDLSAAFAQKGIPLLLDQIILSNQNPSTPSAGGKSFKEEAIPVCDAVLKALSDQDDLPKGLTLRICRNGFYKTSAKPPISIAYGPGDRVEICVEVLGVLASNETGDLNKFVKNAIDASLVAIPNKKLHYENYVALDANPVGDSDSMLTKLGSAGYQMFRDYLSSAQGGQTQAHSALNKKLIKDHVSALIDSLKAAKNLREPIYLEAGVYNAMGIPEFVTALVAQAKELGLQDKVASLTYVLADFNQEALDSARQVLDSQAKEDWPKFEYKKLAHGQDPLTQYRAWGYQDRVIGGRAINLLDAVGTDYVIRIDGELHRVLAQTILPDSAARALESKYGLGSGTLAPFTKALIEKVRANVPFDLKGFIGQSLTAIAENKQVAFWAEYFSSLKQAHSYTRLTREEQRSWLRDVVPNGDAFDLLDAFSWYPREGVVSPDSGMAARVVAGLAPLLHRAGRFYFVNLMVNAMDLARSQRGLRMLGVTTATPPQGDVLAALLEVAGLSATWRNCRPAYGFQSDTSGVLVVGRKSAGRKGTEED